MRVVSFEGAGATAQEEMRGKRERPGAKLWQGWPPWPKSGRGALRLQSVAIVISTRVRVQRALVDEPRVARHLARGERSAPLAHDALLLLVPHLEGNAHLVRGRVAVRVRVGVRVGVRVRVRVRLTLTLTLTLTQARQFWLQYLPEDRVLPGNTEDRFWNHP